MSNLAELSTGVIILTGFFIWTLIYTPIVLYMRVQLRRYWLDVNKVWSISLNGNNALGSVKLVKPTKDGLKTKDGWEIPTEINFAFRERVAGNPIFVWDEDTGLLLRPAAGEVEMSDPVVKNSKEIGEHVDRIQASGDKFPWLPAILVVGILGLIGLFVIGMMLRSGGAG